VRSKRRSRRRLDVLPRRKFGKDFREGAVRHAQPGGLRVAAGGKGRRVIAADPRPLNPETTVAVGTLVTVNPTSTVGSPNSTTRPALRGAMTTGTGGVHDR